MRSRSHLSQTFILIILVVFAILFYACRAVPVEPQITDAVPETATSTEPPIPPTATTTVEALPEHCGQSGMLASYALESELLNDTLAFTVYFPPCYDPRSSEPYPVIYLLHGQQQDGPFWQELGIQAAADELILDQKRQPFLIIMPVEEYYFRSPENNRYPDAILTELLPWVEESFPLCSERDCRAIGGVSRGAAWAVRLAFANPDTFSALGVHSLSLFNGDLEKLPEWINAISRDELPHIYVDVGGTDPAVKDAYAFEEALNALGVEHEWHLNTGRHNTEYWAAQLPAYLDWYTQFWIEEIN